MSRFRELHTSSANLSAASGVTRTHSGMLVPVNIGQASPMERKLRPRRRKYAPLLVPRGVSITTNPQRDLRRKHSTTSEDYCKPGTGPGRFGASGYEGYPFRRDALPGVDMQSTSHSTHRQHWPSTSYATRPSFRPPTAERPKSVDPNIFRSISQTSFQPLPDNWSMRVPGSRSPAEDRNFEKEKNIILERRRIHYPSDLTTTSGATYQGGTHIIRSRPCTPQDSPSFMGDPSIGSERWETTSSAYIRHLQSGPLWRADKGLSTRSTVFLDSR